MLYGIIIQMIALSVYVILGTDFIVRYQLDKPVRKVVRTNDYSSESVNEKSTARPPLEKNLKIMLIGLVINVVFFFIRYASWSRGDPPSVLTLLIELSIEQSSLITAGVGR